MVAPVDFTGKVAGYLTAERSLGSNGRKRMWECRCVCGSAEEVRSIMAEPIAWAPGLPLNGSVGEMMRYAKD